MKCFGRGPDLIDASRENLVYASGAGLLTNYIWRELGLLGFCVRKHVGASAEISALHSVGHGAPTKGFWFSGGKPAS